MTRILPLLFLPVFLHAAEVVDPVFHHIRNAEPREWTHFPEKAEASELHVTFDLKDPSAYQVLTLRQEQTKQPWDVFLNNKKIGILLRDHNHQERGIAIPRGLLKEKGNELVVSTKSDDPDDIHVGDVRLHTNIYNPVSEEQAEDFAKKRGYVRALPEMDAVLELSCTDADSGKPIPCRFTIADAETGALVLLGTESDETTAVREGVIYTLDGNASTRIERGRKLAIYCGRGFEYSLASTEIVTGEGDGKVDLQIKRVVDTPGLAACDPHLHTFEFDRHGDCTMLERQISVAGEGIELPVSTGHDKHVIIPPSPWFTTVPGCEVTTRQGHFNTFPIDPGAKPAVHKFRSWPQVFDNIFETPGVRICIINHARDEHSGFTPLGLENFDPEAGTFLDGRILRANGIELINSGAQQSYPMQLVKDWLALLRSGHQIAGIGSSDSHTVNFAIPGQARTYVACDDSDPANIDINEAVESILAGRTWVSFGLLTNLEIADGGKAATVTVSGPEWSTATRLTIFRNGKKIAGKSIAPNEGETRTGIKWKEEIPLDSPLKEDEFLCAVATGPGITAPWCPMMPSYKPDIPVFTPYVMGISPAVRLKE